MKLKFFLENYKIFFETVAALLISVMAIIISLSQCNISNNQTELLKLQTKIAENTYYSNIDPVVVSNFIDNSKMNLYEIVIKNIGISTVYDIELKNSFRLFGPDFESVPISIKDMEYRTIAQQINPGDSCKFTIRKDHYIEHMISNFPQQKDISIFPVITSNITYKRYPDKKQYNLTKYLFLLYNRKKGIIGSVDLDKSWISPEFINKQYLKNYDSRNNE